MSLDVDSNSDMLIDNEIGRDIFDLKDEDMCGVVYGGQKSCVVVGLMNLKAETSHILTVAAPDDTPIDYVKNYSVALVGSKLFAIGGEPTYPDVDDDDLFYPKEVYSCDLSIINSGESLKFERVATLQEPKISALLVPYKDKLFIIADPCRQPESQPINTPCEILSNLNDDKPIVDRLNPPPFWEGGDASRVVVKLGDHVVVRNRLYVRVRKWVKSVISWTWYCLNMDTHLWEDGECVVPLPSILNKRYKRAFTYVHGDKLFELDWDEDSCIPTFKVVKLKDDDDDDDDMVVVDLKGVVEFVGLKGFYVLDGWVLPCDEHNTDVFCLMIWLQDRPIYEEYIRTCKFKLGDDGSFDIVTKQVVTCGPFPDGKPFVGFTPAITKVLNPGHYEIEIFYNESERLEAQSYKDFVESLLNTVPI
ncbi:hypothetical protein LINGRAHAP2_LOCUS26833 [Linum grandiflorum]